MCLRTERWEFTEADRLSAAAVETAAQAGASQRRRVHSESMHLSVVTLGHYRILALASFSSESPNKIRIP